MAARTTLARTMRQWTSSAAKRPSPFVCSRWHPISQKPRMLSVSAALRKKRYTEDHEWIELSPDGKSCTLGISNYAAHALGDVVYVELPEVSTEFSAGDAIGSVESVKSASDILTPVSGTVTEVNSALEEQPSGINKDPEGDAWIARIAVDGEVDTKELMTAEQYSTFAGEA